MATTTTSSRTVSDNIRGSVAKLLTAELKSSKTSDISQALNAETPQKRNSLFLQASVAFYRASKDRKFRPSASQIKTYAAAVDVIAASRNITPPEGKTAFSDSQLKKELAPQELMKYFAAQTMSTSSDEETAHNQISSDISSVYEENPVPKEVSSLKSMPAPKSDEEVLEIFDQEELNNYMSFLDITEQERLQKLLKAKKYGDDIDPNDIGRYKGPMRDPDWGHKKDDDNFKIEQGDIIDYLMKEVILASAAWAGNKAAGFVGIVGYEIISGVHHNVAEPAWKKVKKIFSSSGKETDGNGSTPYPEGNNDQPANPDILASFNSIYDNNKANYQKYIQAYLSDDPRKDTLLHYQERLLYNTAVIGENQIIEYDSTSKPFNEISSSVDVKKDFTTFRDNIRSAQLSHLKECYPGHDAEVEQWYKHRLAYEENCVLTKDNPTLQQPNTPSFAKDISARLSDYREQQLEMLAFEPVKKQFEAQMGLFAEHYGAYKVYGLSHQNPPSEILTDPQKFQDFIAQSQEEAKYIFLVAENKRRQGEPVLSREALIDEAASLANQAKENPDIKDEKLITIVDPSKATRENTATLMSDYAKTDYTDLYKAEITDISLAEQELGNTTPDLQKRRARAKQAYKNITANKQNPGKASQPTKAPQPNTLNNSGTGR